MYSAMCEQGPFIAFFAYSILNKTDHPSMFSQAKRGIHAPSFSDFVLPATPVKAPTASINSPTDQLFSPLKVNRKQNICGAHRPASASASDEDHAGRSRRVGAFKSYATDGARMPHIKSGKTTKPAVRMRF